MTIMKNIVVFGAGFKGRPNAYGASASLKNGVRFISGFPLR